MSKRIITEEDYKELTWDILSSDNEKFFKEYRMKHNDVWLTKDKKLIAMCDMLMTHIVNSMKMLERLKQTKTAAYNGLQEELARRIKK